MTKLLKMFLTTLGIKISGSGDFTKRTDILSSKAKNALAALRKKLSIEKLPLTIVNRLFTFFCLPICTYGSEVWATSLEDDFCHWEKHDIEKTRLRFCWTFLGVNKCGDGSFSNWNRYIDTKILKYWIHLDSLEDSILVKKAFIMSKALNDTGHKRFHSYIWGLLDKNW